MGIRERYAREALIFLLWCIAPSVGYAQAQEGTCVSCHSGLSGNLAEPVEEYAASVHAARGFGCVSCHGGDAQEFSMAAMDPSRGYVGVPERQQIPTLCGRCHSDAQFMRQYNPALRVDQVAEYLTSVHGQQLMRSNDERVATCVSCHPAHAIKPPSDPTSSVNTLNVAQLCGSCHSDPDYMQPYMIPTDQEERYRQSIHWQMLSVEGDLSAPTCNDCHGNHGAAPPGISWVGNVCGQCHTVMSGLFQESQHARVLAMLGSPGCATCHRNHDIHEAGDELLGLGEGAACGMCHAEVDAGGAVASEMRSLIDSLHREFAKADSVLARAEHAGMEVSEAQFDLNAATTALISARAAVHGFSVDAVRQEVAAGLEVTSRAYERGQKALADLQFRRVGLAVSVTIILLLIVGLVLKIRQIERKTA
jgi:hypothetical protein